MRSAPAMVAMLLLAAAGLSCGSEEPPLDTLAQAATATLRISIAASPTPAAARRI